MTFDVGDAVTWCSQAQGFEVTKHGTVAEVLPAGRRPSQKLFPSLYKHSGCGSARDHVSYVVRVGGRRPYWPRVTHLRRTA